MAAGLQVLLDVAESVRCGIVSGCNVPHGLAIRTCHHRSCCRSLSVRLLPQERYYVILDYFASVSCNRFTLSEIASKCHESTTREQFARCHLTKFKKKNNSQSINSDINKTFYLIRLEFYCTVFFQYIISTAFSTNYLPVNLMLNFVYI